jgi:segregation and condensation protein B
MKMKKESKKKKQTSNEESLKNLADAIANVEQEVMQELESFNSDEQLAKEIEEDKKLAEEIQKELEQENETHNEAVSSLDLPEMESCIEALLFMLDKPASEKRLLELLGETADKKLFKKAMQSLQARYQATNHGIEIAEISGGYQLRTKAGRAHLAKQLSRIQTHRLSSGAMETLALIAYRQPMMKEDIDRVRGVDSSYFIYGLLEKKLVKIVGRSELPGRPMLYGTTDEFLELFSLKDLTSMPALREVESMIPQLAAEKGGEEDPRVLAMRAMVEKMNSDGTNQLGYNPKDDEKILKDISEHVKSIPTSTPYLDEQKELEKQAREAAKSAEVQPSLEASSEVSEEKSENLPDMPLSDPAVEGFTPDVTQ